MRRGHVKDIETSEAYKLSPKVPSEENHCDEGSHSTDYVETFPAWTCESGINSPIG